MPYRERATEEPVAADPGDSALCTLGVDGRRGERAEHGRPGTDGDDDGGHGRRGEDAGAAERGQDGGTLEVSLAEDPAAPGVVRITGARIAPGEVRERVDTVVPISTTGSIELPRARLAAAAMAAPAGAAATVAPARTAATPPATRAAATAAREATAAMAGAAPTARPAATAEPSPSASASATRTCSCSSPPTCAAAAAASRATTEEAASVAWRARRQLSTAGRRAIRTRTPRASVRRARTTGAHPGGADGPPGEGRPPGHGSHLRRRAGRRRARDHRGHRRGPGREVSIALRPAPGLLRAPLRQPRRRLRARGDGPRLAHRSGERRRHADAGASRHPGQPARSRLGGARGQAADLAAQPGAGRAARLRGGAPLPDRRLPAEQVRRPAGHRRRHRPPRHSARGAARLRGLPGRRDGGDGAPAHPLPD